MKPLKWQDTIPSQEGYYWIRRRSKLDKITTKIVYLQLISEWGVIHPFIEEIGWLNRQQPIEFAGPLNKPIE